MAWGLLFIFFGMIWNGISLAQTLPDPPSPDTAAVSSPNPQTSEEDLFKKKTEKPEENVILTDERKEEIREKIQKALNFKNFKDAFTLLSSIPSEDRKEKESYMLSILQVYNKIEKEDAENAALFKKQDDLPKSAQKKRDSLYKEAQAAFLDDRKDITKDLVIHSLYVDRQFFKSKKFLEYVFDLKVGMYKVENMEAKYWNRSSTSFYGGNYLSAIEDLNILAYIERNNPAVYERLGSSYYMSGQKKQAISAWETAMFLDPNNKDLQKLIDKTKELLAKEEEETRLRAEKAVQEVEQETTEGETQLMGVYPKKEQAYSAANEYRKQGFEPIVEEREDGRWIIKVPKAQLKKEGK